MVEIYDFATGLRIDDGSLAEQEAEVRETAERIMNGDFDFDFLNALVSGSWLDDIHGLGVPLQNSWLDEANDPADVMHNPNIWWIDSDEKKY